MTSPSGDSEPERRRPTESGWTKTATVATVASLVVGIVAAYFAYLAIVPKPETPRGGPTPSVSPAPDATGSPALRVAPISVDLGKNVAIVGSGFAPVQRVRVRLVRDDGISYPVGQELIAADGDGGFTISGPVTNQGWCGGGTIAAFAAPTADFEPPPPLSEAIATAQIGVNC